MASRFGRKKRKAMLERVAQLEYEATRNAVQSQRNRNEANSLADALAKLASQMDDWDEDIRQLLGQQTAFAFTPLLMKEKVEGWLSELGTQPSMPDYVDTAAVVMDVMVYREQVYRFIADLDVEERDSLKRLMRLRIVNGANPVHDPKKGGAAPYDWAYAVSKHLWDRGLAERDIVHIAEQIAVQFHARMTAELGRKANGSAAA